jgi:hypothetical protein
MKIFQAKKIPKLSKFIFSSNLQNYFLRNSPGCPRFWATWKLFLSRLVVIESFSDRSCGRRAVLEFENLQFVKGKRDDAPLHMPTPSTQTRAFHAHALLPQASTAKSCGTRVNYLTGPFGKHPKFTCRSRF